MTVVTPHVPVLSPVPLREFCSDKINGTIPRYAPRTELRIMGINITGALRLVFHWNLFFPSVTRKLLSVIIRNRIIRQYDCRVHGCGLTMKPCKSCTNFEKGKKLRLDTLGFTVHCMCKVCQRRLLKMVCLI